MPYVDLLFLSKWYCPQGDAPTIDEAACQARLLGRPLPPSMMAFHKVMQIPEHPARADQSAGGAMMTFNKIIRISEHPLRADKSAVGAGKQPLPARLRKTFGPVYSSGQYLIS